MPAAWGVGGHVTPRRVLHSNFGCCIGTRSKSAAYKISGAAQCRAVPIRELVENKARRLKEKTPRAAHLAITTDAKTFPSLSPPSRVRPADAAPDGGWHSLNSGVAYPCGFGFCKGGTFFSSVLHFEILGQNATAMTAILRQLLAAILSVAIAVPAFSSSCSVGNRLQKTSTLPGMPGTTSSYNANDQLATDTYDNDGNTTASNGKGYSYDFENHLVQQAGITVVYDGDGNRVAKTTANGTTQYLVDDLNPTGYAQVLDEVQSGAAVRTYTWGLELISAHQSINSTPTTSYYVFDGHGSVRALTNASGADTDTYDYDAFGNLIHSTGSTPNNFLFAGEQYDPDLNLYYNRARYLNTSTGRFWTMDTFEGYEDDPPSLHKYLYAESDAVDNVDHCGKCLPAVAGYGDIVQEAIFADFEAKTGGSTNTSINDILGKSVPSGGLLPDLIDPFTLSAQGLGQIWEIKSVYSEAAAVAKEVLYLSVLNFYSKGTGMKWIPGWTYLPPPLIRINGSTFATTDQPFPGVITYCVVNVGEILSVISAAAAAGLYQAVSTATLTTSLAPGI